MEKWTLVNRHWEVSEGKILPHFDIPKLKVFNQIKGCCPRNKDIQMTIKDPVVRQVYDFIKLTLFAL